MNNQTQMSDIQLQAQQQQLPFQQTPYQPNPFNQQPNPFNQPQTYPYDPASQVNNGAFAACNQGLANGFGEMFFNIRDPNFTQKNEPVKQGASWHLAVVIFNLIFIGWLVTGMIGLNNFLSLGLVIGLICGLYVLYLIIGCCCSDIKEYIHNMKKFDQYQETYDQMVKGRGYFSFWIECYHYQTYRDRKGRTHTRKVVTHTARQNFQVSECFDESGEVQGIMDISSHIFVEYLKRYYFTDDASQGRFVAAFNSFVSRNTRDTHQNYTQTFMINGFEPYVAFSALGDGSKSVTLFYVTLLLGLAFAYACIFERTVSRYQIGILKRLTIN